MRRRFVVGAVVALVAAAAIAARGRTPGARASGAIAAAHPPHRPLDVTFLVTADTHFGFTGTVPIGGDAGVPIDTALAAEIAALNGIPGALLPTPGGGVVGEPRGVLVAGDLTDGGHPTQWSKFEAAFGLTGKDGAVDYPVYEGAGNHDRWGGTYVERQIARRHGAAKYSWNWDDVHVVCLGEAPDDTDLAWLAKDLAPLGQDIGVVLFLHFPLDGPNSTGQWFGDGPYRDKLANTLEGHQVLGIFSGHSHTSGVYRWKGHDAYLEGSVKHAWPSFSVVHVTESRMTVVSYNWRRRAFWWWHDKPVFGAAGTARSWFSPGDRLVTPR